MLYNDKWDKKIKTVEPWRQTLLDAADLIDQRGWCQGCAQDDKGRLCVIGALRVALGYDAGGILTIPPEQEKNKEMSDVFEKFKPFCENITHWNDKKQQTQLNVTSTMRLLAYN